MKYARWVALFLAMTCTPYSCPCCAPRWYARLMLRVTEDFGGNPETDCPEALWAR